jgi:diguanylate cyclase (GGDEF)-like protein/PAS domain S-box-containing protein
MKKNSDTTLLLYQGIIDTIHEPLLVLDEDYKILFASRSFYSTFNVTPADTIGNSIYDIGNRQWNNPELRELLNETLTNNQEFNRYEITHDFIDIGRKTMLLNARKIYAAEKQAQTILLAIDDITYRKSYEDKLHQLAMTDPLTGLLNRNSFYADLNTALSLSKRMGIVVGLISLDLDDFKQVNDTHGHHIGDELLKEVASSLIMHTRDIDHVARLGGDEFSVVSISSNNVIDIEILVKRMIKDISRQRKIEGNTLKIGASAGMSICPKDSFEPDKLMKMSDKALYRAKNQGKGTFVFYDKEIDCLSG